MASFLLNPLLSYRSLQPSSSCNPLRATHARSVPRDLGNTSQSSHIEREADEPGDYSFVPALSSIASSAVSSPNKTGDNISAQEEGGGGRDDEDDDEELPKRGLPMSREASHDCGNDVEESTERWEPNMELELWNFHPGTLKYLAQVGGVLIPAFET